MTDNWETIKKCIYGVILPEDLKELLEILKSLAEPDKNEIEVLYRVIESLQGVRGLVDAQWGRESSFVADISAEDCVTDTDTWLKLLAHLALQCRSKRVEKSFSTFKLSLIRQFLEVYCDDNGVPRDPATAETAHHTLYENEAEDCSIYTPFPSYHSFRYDHWTSKNGRILNSGKWAVPVEETVLFCKFLACVFLAANDQLPKKEDLQKLSKVFYMETTCVSYLSNAQVADNSNNDNDGTIIHNNGVDHRTDDGSDNEAPPLDDDDQSHTQQVSRLQDELRRLLRHAKKQELENAELRAGNIFLEHVLSRRTRSDDNQRPTKKRRR